MARLPNDFSAYLCQDRRLFILRLLASQGDYMLNDRLLLQGLDQLGHGIAHRVLVEDLCFLAGKQLIKTETLSKQIVRVRLLAQGMEILMGKLTCEGVRSPSPAEIIDDA